MFDSWLDLRGYANTTRRDYCLYVRRALEWCDQHQLVLPDATTDDLTQWVLTLNPTPQSRSQARKALIAYFRSIGREPNPAQDLPRQKAAPGLPRPIGGDAHLRWVAAARDLGGRHELAGILLVTTAVRISELRHARWVDFDLTEHTWRVRGKGSGCAGPRWRLQPLHPAAVELLEDQPRPSPHLFPGKCGPLSDSQLRIVIVEIGEHAGLGRVTPHRIRHQVATSALAATGDLRAVQSLLGHASIQSTVRYTELVSGRLTSLLDGLPT